MNIVGRLSKRISVKGNFAKGVVIIAGGTALAQLLSMLAFPLLTRLYMPDEFGVFAIYLSVIALLMAVASLRYEWAIPIAENDQNAANLLALCLMLLLISATVSGLIFLAFGRQIVGLGNLMVLRPYLWVLPFGVLGSGLYQILSAWAIRRKTFTQLARTSVNQSLGRTLAQLGLGFSGLGVLGLLLGDLVGRFSGNGTLSILIWRHDRDILAEVSISRIQWVAHRYRRFPLFSTGSSVLNTAGLQIPNLLLAVFYPVEVVGWFALSQRVFGVPIGLIGNSITQVFWAEASRLVHNNPKELQRIYFRLSRQLFILGLLVGFLAFISPWFFGVIFGDEWELAGIYARSLAPMFVLQLAVPSISHLTVHELQHWQFFWDGTRLVVVGSVLWIAHSNGRPPEQTIALYSWSMCVMYAVLFLLNVYALSMKVKVSEIEAQRAP